MNLENNEKQLVKNIYLQSLWAVTFAVLLVQMCTIINSLMVGNFIGKEGLAVLSIVSPVGFVFATIGSLLAVGGSIKAAHYIGQNNREGCNACLYSAIKIMIVFGIAFTVLIIVFVEPLMGWLKVPEEIYDQTKQYLLVYAPVAFAAMAIYVPFNFFKINGIQRYTVVINSIMFVVNIVLDYVLVKIFNMGMAGIGIATTVANWSASLPGLILLYTKKGGFVRPSKRKSKKMVLDMIVAGSPSAINNFATFLRALCLNLIILDSLGSDGLSVFSIVTTVFMFSVIITNGTSLSMASFAAVFSSEKDVKSLKQIFVEALTAAVVLMSVFVLLVEIFPAGICRMFSITDAALVSKCVFALRIFAVSLIICAVNTIFSTFYQSIKKTILSNVITAFRGFVFVVLFAWILSSYCKSDFIWFAFIIAEVLTLIMTLAIALVYSRHKADLSPVLLVDIKYQEEGHYYAFSVNNDDAMAAECSAKITEFCEQNDMSPKLTMAIGLAIEEILVSFNNHALKNKSESVTSNVRILVMPDVVVLRFRMVGEMFNPLEYADANDDLLSDAIGIKMVQKMSEVVMYDRVFGVNNLTILF